MNWIDNKYKEKLGNKKFPDGLKEVGWSRAQKLLDEQMPVAAVKSSWSFLGRYLVIAMIIVAIPTGWWLYSGNNSAELENELKETEVKISTEEIEDLKNIVNQEVSNTSNSVAEDLEIDAKNGGGNQLEETFITEDRISPESENNNENSNSESISANNNAVANTSDDEIDINVSTVNEATTYTAGQDALHNQVMKNNQKTEVDGALSSKTENNNTTKGNNLDPALRTSDDTLNKEQLDVLDKPESVDKEGGTENNNKPIAEEDPVVTDVDQENKDVLNRLEDEKINNGDINQDRNLDNKPEDGNGVSEEEENSINEPLENSNVEGGKKTFEISEAKLDPAMVNPSISLEKETDKKENPNVSPNRPLDSPANTSLSENSAITTSKVKRKNHLAFLEKDLPIAANVAEDYQLFSRERFSISLWGGYMYTDKFLEASNSQYVDARKTSERGVYTTPTGVSLDYFVDNNWTFGTGISWSEYGEELNYNFSRIDTARIDGRFTKPSDFSNVVYIDSTRIIDSINVGHWNYTLAYAYNDTLAAQNNGRTSWQYIEIPFTIGYRFGTGRIKPWIRTGFSLGIPSQTSFRYINPQATELNDASLKNTLVAPIQYNYLLSVGIDCYLSRSISLRLNGISSVQLNSSLQQATIKQRYYRIGASLGLAYNF